MKKGILAIVFSVFLIGCQLPGGQQVEVIEPAATKAFFYAMQTDDVMGLLETIDPDSPMHDAMGALNFLSQMKSMGIELKEAKFDGEYTTAVGDRYAFYILTYTGPDGVKLLSEAISLNKDGLIKSLM